MHKEDLALNNLQRLICHETKPNQTSAQQSLLEVRSEGKEKNEEKRTGKKQRFGVGLSRENVQKKKKAKEII